MVKLVSYFFTMKHILFCLFSWVSIVFVQAAKLSDMYFVKNLPDGKLYFVFENKLQCIENSDYIKYDLTYCDSNDSVSIKMSIYQKNFSTIDSLAFNNGYERYVTIPSLFYHEQFHKKWLGRYDNIVPFNFINQAFNSTNPLTISIYSQGKVTMFSMHKSKWKNFSPKMQDIFEMIQINKNR